MNHIEETETVLASLWLRFQHAETLALAIYAGLALLLITSVIRFNKPSSVGHIHM